MEHNGRRSAYADTLRDPRWQRMRLGVMQRDGWMCKMCWDKEAVLAVHHRYYLPGKEPWEYPMDAFVTLCERCHQGETQARPEAERQLLLAMRMAGFYAPEVHKIANVFSRLRTRSGLDARLAAYVIVKAIKNFLSRREAYRKNPAQRLSADQIVPRDAPRPDQKGGRDGGCQAPQATAACASPAGGPKGPSGVAVAGRASGDGGAAAAG